MPMKQILCTPCFEGLANNPLKILELGCGTGTHSFLLEKGHEIVGTDLSPDMISKAKIKAETMGSKISFFARICSNWISPHAPLTR